MKGDQGVIDYLNKALRAELTAVSQYWLHYRLQEDWATVASRRRPAARASRRCSTPTG